MVNVGIAHIERWQIAKKSHECHTCGETIQPGERYVVLINMPTRYTPFMHEKTCDGCFLHHYGYDK